MKTKEELLALKKQVEELNKKLTELTEEELSQVTAGESDVTGSAQYKKRKFICSVCRTVLKEETVPYAENDPATSMMPMMRCPVCEAMRKTIYIVEIVNA